jgi:hypothetical protein
MDDHCCEENWVKPWERAIEACNEAPGKRKKFIAGIMDLPSHAIYMNVISTLGPYESLRSTEYTYTIHHTKSDRQY